MRNKTFQLASGAHFSSLTVENVTPFVRFKKSVKNPTKKSILPQKYSFSFPANDVEHSFVCRRADIHCSLKFVTFRSRFNQRKGTVQYFCQSYASEKTTNYNQCVKSYNSGRQQRKCRTFRCVFILSFQCSYFICLKRAAALALIPLCVGRSNDGRENHAIIACCVQKESVQFKGRVNDSDGTEKED